MSKDKIFNSICGDMSARGTAQELVRKYEGYGYGADRQKSYREAHLYWQYADHYKRISNEQKYH